MSFAAGGGTLVRTNSGVAEAEAADTIRAMGMDPASAEGRQMVTVRVARACNPGHAGYSFSIAATRSSKCPMFARCNSGG